MGDQIQGEVLIMRNNGQPRMVRPEPLIPERRRESFNRWYNFLEDECLKSDGLLCFYDRHKSREVTYFCGLLADCLTAPAQESADEDLGKMPDIKALTDQREDSYASLKSVSKL